MRSCPGKLKSAPVSPKTRLIEYMSSRIENYALIGNTRTAALIDRTGSVDWLCVPRFDSGACFAALLGSPANGRWLLAPEHPIRQTRRRYLEDTLILETEFETETGTASVLDFMPLPESGGKVSMVRLVKGRRGSVAMATELVLRFDYGRIVPWVRRRDYGVLAVAGPDAVQLRTPIPTQGRNLTTVANFVVSKDEAVPFTLTWYPSHLDEPDVSAAPDLMLEQTDAWWRKWSGQCRYEGEWRESVMRSLITLKALTYSPTGGIVAAPTTSLPEQPGGVRNWDYRFCWLRDATFTLYSLIMAGYTDEARAWHQWLLRAVAGKPDDLQVVYGVSGERRLDELELPWLSGYQDSRPVRIGNAAHYQVQLDILGEVMDSLYAARGFVAGRDDDAWRVQKSLVQFFESAWNQPDHGIWEVRGKQRHFTHSKVMAWVGVDRALKTARKFGLHGDLNRWRVLRDTIHRDVCQRGYSSRRESFVQYYDSSEVDASLLMIPLVGFLPANDPRVAGTLRAIERELMVDGFVARYRDDNPADGLPAGEGAFLACSFWYADVLSLMGRGAEARAMFERLLALRNDVGLLSEEYDPVSKRQTGNFPQAFSHVGLINTAHNLTLAAGPAVSRSTH
jgi:GH15 family glucan-1,4-alpha-glucosidase